MSLHIFYNIYYFPNLDTKYMTVNFIGSGNTEFQTSPTLNYAAESWIFF